MKDDKQLELPRVPGRPMRRPRLFADEQLRQAQRAHRKAHAEQYGLPGAERAQQHALALARRVAKGDTMDRESVTKRLQDHETEYGRGKQMLAQFDAQRVDMIRNLTRLEGAMLTLRQLLGDDAPPVPEALAPKAEPPAETEH